MVELTAAANYFGFLYGIVNAFEVTAPPADGDRWCGREDAGVGRSL